MDIRNFWKLMSPRLTVLTTTLDSKGKADVSPFSFVTPVSFDPPLLMIAVGINKHSYWNITQRKEFVINISTEDLIGKILIAGSNWDPEKSKIERANLSTKKATKVGPPLLTECPINIECYVKETKKAGDHVMIIGEVVEVHVNEDLIDEKERLKVGLIKNPLHVSGGSKTEQTQAQSGFQPI